MSADDLTAAREALARHEWQAAHDATCAIETTGPIEEAERLDLLAEASWWLGRLDACIEARERAHRLFDECGDELRAGLCAIWLFEHHGMKCRPAVAGGWLRRARRTLTNHPETAEYDRLLLREVEVARGNGEFDHAVALTEQVVDSSRRRGSTDLEAEALQALGRLRIAQGDVAEGLACLDDAMLFAVEGRLGPYATGKVYCSLTSACEELGDMRRAAEWTEAAARWAQQHPFTIFPGICRVHRALVLGWRGDLAGAEREATQACAELIDIHGPNAAEAFATVGDIRRRLGDVDGAEAAFASAEELCGQPCSGLAMLRLDQGRLDEAASIIRRALDHRAWDRLGRAMLIPADVQISLALGDVAAARRSADELQSIARDVDSDALHATALSTRARVHLAEGDVDAAAAAARRAMELWQELEAPHEVEASRSLVDRAAAQAVADTATSTARLPAGLTNREVEVLLLVADGRTNKDIAAELHLSAKTVSRHLSNIFAKIDVTSRSAATAFAFEHHLVAR